MRRSPRPVPPGRAKRNKAGSPFRVNDDSRFTARTSATAVTMAPITMETATDRPAFRELSWAIPLAMPSA